MVLNFSVKYIINVLRNIHVLSGTYSVILSAHL